MITKMTEGDNEHTRDDCDNYDKNGDNNHDDNDDDDKDIYSKDVFQSNSLHYKIGSTMAWCQSS